MVLHLAIDAQSMWMLPGELYSIEQGLEFKEIAGENGTYRGYTNIDGEEEGVGITTFKSGEKHSGEYKQGLFNGVTKTEFVDGNTYWGQEKAGLNEGYGTFQWKSNGQIYTGQWKDDKKNGYGICRLPGG